MVLDAILMSLGEITSALSSDRDVAIIPEWKPQDAFFTNEEYQVLFGGSIDYGIIEYKRDENDDNQGNFFTVTCFVPLISPVQAASLVEHRATHLCSSLRLDTYFLLKPSVSCQQLA
jgi:hypothetical protein